jgi:uncharacterized membrane protein
MREFPIAVTLGGSLRSLLRVALLFLLSGISFPAAADLELCNRTSFVLETAVGIEEQGVAATRGWFRVDPGVCRSVMRGDANFEKIFVHARALPVYGALKPLLPSVAQLCVGEGEFLIGGARRCETEKQRLVAFGEMKPRESENGRAVHLAEPADYTPEQARLAAVQRLLALAGAGAEPVDGMAGPRTDAALSQFLRERKLPAQSVSAPDFLDVLLAAVREGAGPGLLWCNETAYAVMAALGLEQAGGVVARGWWRIEAGSCLRPDLPRKTGARVYSFAEAVSDTGAVIERAGKPLAWGGDKRLCVRNSRFEIDDHNDCAARGLTAQGFAAVELPQGAGATVRFRER